MSQPPVRPASLLVTLVLHHSPLALLERVLESLRVAVAVARSEGLLSEARLCVADNSLDAHYARRAEETTRGAVEGAPELTLSFRVLRDNPGFGASHNVLLGEHALVPEAGADLCLILNPDVILDARALAVGVSMLQADTGLAGLGPCATTAAGTRESLSKRYPSVYVLFLRGFAPSFLRRLGAGALTQFEMTDSDEAQVIDVPLLSGCCMLLRSSSLRSCRGFDPAFFMYFEDFDLSLRLRAHGRLLRAPGMRVVHYGGNTATKGWRHVGWFVGSGIRFFNRHGWRWI